MKKFDLEKALAGEPVRDVCGDKRFILKHPQKGYLIIAEAGKQEQGGLMAFILKTL